jgi:hypothetical protein
MSPLASISAVANLSRFSLDGDWCPTFPKKFPPPPPPAPATQFERFAQIAFDAPKHILDDWCGTKVPGRFPPPPPPAPWVDGINQMMSSRV